MGFDPVALGWLTQSDLGLLFALAGLACGVLVVSALISNL